MIADEYTLKICAYKKFLICTINDTPKKIINGTGVLLSNFNKKDLQISSEALMLIKNSMLKINQNIEVCGLKIFNKNKIFIASHDNIIIPKEHIAIYDIPVYTEISNDVDEKLKKELDTYGKTE